MVPTILTAREGVQIEIDADPVFAGPLDSLQEVPEKLDLSAGSTAT